MNENYYFIAVDFDGTLCENVFPEIGKPRLNVIDSLKDYFTRLNAAKTVKVILWTCREDLPGRVYLTEAVEWCKEQGVLIDFANENPLCNFDYPEKVRKIAANKYRDDRAVTV